MARARARVKVSRLALLHPPGLLCSLCSLQPGLLCSLQRGGLPFCLFETAHLLRVRVRVRVRVMVRVRVRVRVRVLLEAAHLLRVRGRVRVRS